MSLGKSAWDSWDDLVNSSYQKGDDPLEMLYGLSAFASMLWVRRQLRKKGAPEWVAYAVSIADYSITVIGLHLHTMKRHQLKSLYRDKA